MSCIDKARTHLIALIRAAISHTWIPLTLTPMMLLEPTLALYSVAVLRSAT